MKINYQVWAIDPVSKKRSFVKTFETMREAGRYVRSGTDYNPDILHISKTTGSPDSIVTDSEGKQHHLIECNWESPNAWYFADEAKVAYMVNELRKRLNDLDPKYKGLFSLVREEDCKRKKTFVTLKVDFSVPYKRIAKNPYADDGEDD